MKSTQQLTSAWRSPNLLMKNKGYCYLGIMEGTDFHCDDVEEITKKDYVSRVQKILNASMNSDYTMTAICAYAITVLCYTFRIMK
eukprot:2498669-Ditylum_brightwellii.AAC.2